MAVVENMDSTEEQPNLFPAAISEKEPPPPGTEEDVIEIPMQTSLNSLVSSSVIDDEHEEGEIEDDDEVVLEYEDISSDEEVNIRVRIAQLEAMDDEIRKINQITGASIEDTVHFGNDTFISGAHDKPAVIDVRRNAVYECISDEEDVELYLRRYEPIPKPKLLPVRRRRLRPLRAGSQRPTGSSSSVSRRHGESKRRVEKRKHEQSSARKGNLYRTRHKRRKQHVCASMVNIIESSGSEEDFPLDRARLQAACNIDAGKRKTDKENWDALKQKLKLSMQKRKQKQSETNKEVEVITDEPMVLVVDEDDEEDEEDEEVLQLRLQALKSKAEVKESGVINLIEDPIVSQPVAEEQQLRMIALRSAFTKKHEIRQKKKQGERPYSPSDELFLFTSPIEEDDDDEVQIIEARPETVEIADSDEENRMEISPEPQCPEPPETIQSIDMELATSGESRSPMTLAASHEQIFEAKEDSPELEPPPPPVISGDFQCKLPEEDDEESLRNHLLSNLSANVKEPVPVSMGTRPMTPDSISEEEADALRELILSKMHKKTSKKQISPVKTDLIESEVPDKTEITDIPNSIQDNNPAAIPCTMEPLTISINNGVLPLPPEESQLPLSALNLTVSTNQSKVQPHPNLITLIGKQKITRKKRKKSSSTTTAVTKTAPQQVQQQMPTNNQILAIAVPRPSRTLINTPAVQKPPPSLPPPPKIMVTTKKLVNNPNKLINFNAPVQPVLIPSPKERSTLLENYVQKPVSRMIIQVGNSDSDSDPDYYPAPDLVLDPATELEAEQRLREAFLRDMDNASPSRVMLESPTYSPAPLTPTSVVEMDSNNPQLEAPVVACTKDVAFEQRLDQFLRTVRSQIDQSKATVGEREKEPRTIVAPTQRAGSGSGGWETAAKTARKPIMAPAAPITPSAVRHLPKSAQLEYRRLVARMALLEKQKQQRVTVPSNPRLPPPPIAPPPALSGPLHPLTKTIINTGPNEPKDVSINHDLVVTVNRDRRDVVSKISSNGQQPSKRICEPLVKRVLINNTVIAERETNVQDVAPLAIITNDEQPPPESASDTTINAAERMSVKVASSVTNRRTNASQDVEVSSLREALMRLPLLKEDDRRKVLTIAEHRFEKHSQKFAHDLQELIGTVENAQLERQKQYDLENKVAFLKEKLMVLERALSLHKNRLNDIFPALQESHAKVMASRKRSIELNNICLAIGRETHGRSYSPPSSERNEIHEQLKVLTTETKRLKEMKRLSLDEFKQLTAEQRRLQHERQKHAIEEQLVKSVSPQFDDQLRPPTAEPPPTNDDEYQNKTNENMEPQQTAPELDLEPKQYAKSAPTSRSVSPSVVSEQDQHGVTQEAPAALACEMKSQFKQYTSPLVSLKDQSALNIPDGVICPYQMRGECIDQDCKYDHFK